MNNHLPPAPNIPPLHPGRRQTDYNNNYQVPAHTLPAHHNPYANYHPPNLYHPTHLAPHQYPQQWYQPYPQYAPPPPPPRQFQPQAPLVVSSHQHAQPVASDTQRQSNYSASRQQLNPSQASKTPQPDVSAQPSLQQPINSNATTPTTASVTNSNPASAPKTPASVAIATAAPPPAQQLPALAPVTQREPFYPKLPWYSVPESSFPPRVLRRRRKKKTAQLSSNPLELPSRLQSLHIEDEAEQIQPKEVSTATTTTNETDTPPTSLPPSEAESTDLTTPTSSIPNSSSNVTLPNEFSHKRTATKPIVPVVPITPIVPAVSPPGQRSTNATEINEQKAASTQESEKIEPPVNVTASTTSETPPLVVSPPPKAPPKSWAELLRSKGPANEGSLAGTGAGGVVNGSPLSKSNSLADALRMYHVGSEGKISFLEPRGLVNTGNMCYMNSILQVLVFCVPFYEFLDQIGKRAVHSFKNETPLVEAMIMFMREFSIIDSASSVNQLRMRLKDNELEQYGEAFIPEYVYEVINRLPRFSTMRRGHQQDAEEFLGFLLEGLHDECVHVLRKLAVDPTTINIPASTTPPATADAIYEAPASPEAGWLEVGPKQKAAVTRSSGTISTESPITKIFGGKLRSEFSVPGLKKSVTLEPYQPLQLDIGLPNVHNITDALKGLTHPEKIQGDFNSPRGPGTGGSKQVFIETLPPVLILHLKRFQYDNSGGTQKIWKKIGYPLELEIPKEVFAPNKRGSYAIRPGGLPKYRLIGVVYHHGKSASGGHYTVDIRRQEGREWLRMDDTVLRRVRSEEVAAEGSEEDPKILARALEEHKRKQSGDQNIYKQAGFDEDDGEDDDNDQGGGWSQVNGSTTSPTTNHAKKWSGVVNGSSTPNSGKRTPKENKFSFKDNKVAYILFYQEIRN